MSECVTQGDNRYSSLKDICFPFVSPDNGASFKGVGMELALRSILPVVAFIQLRMAAHLGFSPFPFS